MEKANIFLRPFQPDDAERINVWRNDQELQRMTGGPIRYVSLEMEREWVRKVSMDNSKNLYWAICVNDLSRKMIGYISLNNIDHLNKSADAGGTLIGDKDARNGDYGFEALTLVLDYAFNQLNLHRITASCLPDHYFAPHSLYAFGFKKEGTGKDEVYKNGHYHDMDHYALMRKDYDKLNSKGEYQLDVLIKKCASHIRQTKKLKRK